MRRRWRPRKASRTALIERISGLRCAADAERRRGRPQASRACGAGCPKGRRDGLQAEATAELDARKQREIEERDRRTLTDLAGRGRTCGSTSAPPATHLDGWLSIDIRPDEQCFGMDAAKPWPFETASAEAVNSEHFIEHLTLEEARVYLSEAYRVLRPGGLIRTHDPEPARALRAVRGGRPALARGPPLARVRGRRPTETCSTTTSTPGSIGTSTTSRVWPRCCARRGFDGRPRSELRRVEPSRSCTASTGTTPRSSGDLGALRGRRQARLSRRDAAFAAL